MLRGVAGSGPDDVWAVGDGVLHWDGSAWTPVDAPAAALNAVWAASPSDAWALGPAGAILRWNGATWSKVSGVTTQDLTGVWGANAADLWMVSATEALHWTDGVLERWPLMGSFANDRYRISGTGPDDVWFAGPRVFRWDGVALREDPTWSAPITLCIPYIRGVFAGAPGAVWLVGSVSSVMGGGCGDFILRWDGTGWRLESDYSHGWGSAVWGPSADLVWVAGSTLAYQRN